MIEAFFMLVVGVAPLIVFVVGCLWDECLDLGIVNDNMIQLLNLKTNDVLLIAIKRASEQEKEEYLVKT